MSFLDRFKKEETSGDEISDMFASMEMASQSLQFQLEKGMIDWNDDAVQLFLPVILNFTDYDWLKLIAKHSIYNEKEVISFIEYVKQLHIANARALENKVR